MRKNAERPGIQPVALLVLVIALAGAIAMSWRQEQYNTAIARERFDSRAAVVEEQLLKRIGEYEYGLRGARGAVLAAGEEGLSRSVFRRYAESRELDREFPGARGFGFIRRVLPTEEQAFVEAARRDEWPQFSIRQLTPHGGERFVIQYIEPVRGNEPAVGLDVASESNRLTAALAAARSGRPTLTGPITLVQATGLKQRSFLFLLPIYRSEVSLATADERLRGTWGWSYAPLIIDEILSSFDHTESEFALALFDVTDANSVEPFFTRGAFDNTTAGTLNATSEHGVFGRKWRIEIRALPAFYSELNLLAPATVFFSWAAAAVLFAVLVQIYLTAKARQRQVAEQQARLARIVADSNDAIIGTDLKGVVTSWNRSAERILGYAAEQAIGRSLVSLVVPEEYEPQERDILERVAQGEAISNFYTRRHRADGNLIDVVDTVSPIFDDEGRVIGAAKTLRDVTEIKRAEAALRATQERLTTATYFGGIGVWEHNLVTNELIVDDTIFTMYGRTPTKYANANEAWFASVHPDDKADQDRRLMAAIATRKQHDATFRIVTEAGEIRYIRTRGNVTYDADGRPIRILGTNIDCTAEKLREHQLDELNATLEQQVAARTAELSRLHALQRAILADAAYAVISTKLDGVITHFNPAAEKLLGYRAEEVVGKVTPAIIHDADEVAARAKVLSADLNIALEPGFEVFVAKAKRGVTDTNEWTYIRKDGSRLPVLLSVSALRNESGEAFGYLGMVVDLTERRANEQKLRDSERFLQAVADNIPGMVAYWDRDLRCRFTNVAYRKWFGKTDAELRGIHLRELLDPESYARAQQHVVPAMSGEAQHFERKITYPDGSESYMWVNYIPDRDERGVRGMYVLASDVSEMKHVQLKLESLNASLDSRTREAESANRAKSEFLANMSHEIRTPLNAILGLTHLLADTPMNAAQRASFGKIQTAGRSLLAVINDLLDLSKIEAGEMHIESAPFDVSELLRGLKEVLSPQAEQKGLRLLIPESIPDVPGWVTGDETRIRQILLNLVGNAVKFTSQGKVELVLECVASEGDEYRVRWMVRDTGIGIAPDALAKLFTPFTQADASTTRRFGGTGLGLSIVRKLAEIMGGAVGVSSVVGVGSEFWLELPLRAAAEPARVAAVAERSTLHGVRVLAVDDSEINREVAKGILERAGATVTVCADGGDAVALLRVQSSDFDIVLMDLQMPGLDGYAATRKIRSDLHLDDLPIVALTAGAMVTERQAALDSGMNDFVGKPFEPHKLIQAIARLTGQVVALSAASSIVAAPPAQWLAIEGIDISDVRHRIGEKPELFEKLLRIFVRDYGDWQLGPVPSDMAERAALTARVHKLRGASGLLGVLEVFRLATTIEEILSSKREEPTLNSLLAELQLRLKTTVASIQAVLQGGESSVQTQRTDSAALCQTEIDDFIALLRRNDLLSLRRFQELQHALRGALSEAHYAELQTAVEGLRFAVAADVLSAELKCA